MSSETTEDLTCHQVEPLLDELVDGQLGAAAHARVRAHLAACESCAASLASLEELLASAAALPRSVEPRTDLWPSIAPRLAARPAGRWPVWMRQALAAMLLMALGGVLSQVLWPAGLGAGRDAGPAPGGDVALAAALDPRADFALAEADYLRAKEALWAAAYHGRHVASPETREVVEHNLRVIDEAIEELRLALAADPGNQQLESLLLAQHRTEIDLLQRLRRATEIS